MRGLSMKAKYLETDSKITGYMPLPNCLIKCGLNSTTLLVYGMLLGRATLSQKNEWVDEQGKVYIRYAIEQLAKDAGKSISTIKSCLKELDDEGLIVRKRVGYNTANLIYVLLPEDCMIAENLPVSKPKNQTTVGQNSGLWTDRKPATNNYSNIFNKTNNRTVNRVKNYTYVEGESF